MSRFALAIALTLIAVTAVAQTDPRTNPDRRPPRRQATRALVASANPRASSSRVRCRASGRRTSSCRPPAARASTCSESRGGWVALFFTDRREELRADRDARPHARLAPRAHAGRVPREASTSLTAWMATAPRAAHAASPTNAATSPRCTGCGTTWSGATRQAAVPARPAGRRPRGAARPEGQRHPRWWGSCNPRWRASSIAMSAPGLAAARRLDRSQRAPIQPGSGRGRYTECGRYSYSSPHTARRSLMNRLVILDGPRARHGALAAPGAGRCPRLHRRRSRARPAAFEPMGSSANYALVDVGAQAPDFSFDIAGPRPAPARPARAGQRAAGVRSPTRRASPRSSASARGCCRIGVVPVAVLDQRAGACSATARAPAAGLRDHPGSAPRDRRAVQRARPDLARRRARLVRARSPGPRSRLWRTLPGPDRPWSEVAEPRARPAGTRRGRSGLRGAPSPLTPSSDEAGGRTG